MKFIASIGLVLLSACQCLAGITLDAEVTQITCGDCSNQEDRIAYACTVTDIDYPLNAWSLKIYVNGDHIRTHTFSSPGTSIPYGSVDASDDCYALDVDLAYTYTVRAELYYWTSVVASQEFVYYSKLIDDVAEWTLDGGGNGESDITSGYSSGAYHDTIYFTGKVRLPGFAVNSSYPFKVKTTVTSFDGDSGVNEVEYTEFNVTSSNPAANISAVNYYGMCATSGAHCLRHPVVVSETWGWYFYQVHVWTGTSWHQIASGTHSPIINWGDPEYCDDLEIE